MVTTAGVTRATDKLEAKGMPGATGPLEMAGRLGGTEVIGGQEATGRVRVNWGDRSYEDRRTGGD